MTPDQINSLSREELLDVMRREGVPVSISMFATIHHKSADRPSGFDKDDLDQISDDLEDGDLRRWRAELAAHFANKG
jgi:hypothetical protein